MYAFRLVAVLFLILVVLVAYSPQARVRVADTWDNIRPAVVDFMDSFYAAIRSIITGVGNDKDDHFDGTPTPANPGVNFDRIVTANSSLSF